MAPLGSAASKKNLKVDAKFQKIQGDRFIIYSMVHNLHYTGWVTVWDILDDSYYTGCKKFWYMLIKIYNIYSVNHNLKYTRWSKIFKYTEKLKFYVIFRAFSNFSSMFWKFRDCIAIARGSACKESLARPPHIRSFPSSLIQILVTLLRPLQKCEPYQANY